MDGYGVGRCDRRCSLGGITVALMLMHDAPIGIVVEDAYHKVVFIGGNKDILSITVGVFMSKAASDSKMNPINQFSYSFIPSVGSSAPEFIQQAYEYLKTLPEFAAAVDVLEE